MSQSNDTTATRAAATQTTLEVQQPGLRNRSPNTPLPGTGDAATPNAKGARASLRLRKKATDADADNPALTQGDEAPATAALTSDNATPASSADGAFSSWTVAAAEQATDKTTLSDAAPTSNSATNAATPAAASSGMGIGTVLLGALGLAAAAGGGGKSGGTPPAPSTDTTAPTLASLTSSATGTVTGPVTLTFKFSEAVNGFTVDSVNVTGASKGTFTAVSASEYTLLVSPTANAKGSLTVSVANTGVKDSAGNALGGVADYSQAYDTTVDNMVPTVTATVTDNVPGTANGPVTYTIAFSEGVKGFDASKLSLTGGILSGFAANADGKTYTVVATPDLTTTGTLQLSVNPSGVTDLAGNAMVSVPTVADQAYAQNLLQGSIVAGPVLSTHSLSIKVFNAAGQAIGAASVSPSGSYTVALGSYTGPVAVLVVDADNQPDYMDEVSKKPTDLNVSLLAAGNVVVSTALQTLNINPITTVAALKAGFKASTDGTSVVANTDTALVTKINTANTAVAKALLGSTASAADLLTTEVKPTVNLNGSPNGSANLYGKMLAVLSGMDSANGGNVSQTLSTLVTGIDSSGTLSSTLQTAVKSAATTAGVVVSELPSSATGGSSTSGDNTSGGGSTGGGSSTSGGDLGLSDIQSVALDTTATSTTTNGYLHAGDTVVVSVAIKPVDVAGTGAPKIALNIGGTTVYADFDSTLSSGTTNLSTLKFKAVLPAGSSTALSDTNGLSIDANAITLGSATINLAGTSTAAKITHALVADNASYLVDNVPPTATPTAATATLVEAGGVNNATAGTAASAITINKNDNSGSAAVGFDTATMTSSSGGWTDAGSGTTFTKAGTYGTATFTKATGVVSYALNNNSAATQALTQGQNVNDSFTIAVIDTAGNKSAANAVFAITGSNDTPTVSAAAPSAALVEAGGVNNATAGTSSATIALSKADVDGSASFDTGYLTSNGWSSADSGATYAKTGTYGSATLTISTGVVSYALDNNSTATQALTQGQSVSDAFGLIQVTDGSATAQSTAISFAITGSNDTPTVSAVIASALKTDASSSSQINLLNNASDADAGETATLSVTNVTYKVGTGSPSATLPAGFTLSADGKTLTVNPADPAYDSLNSSQSQNIVVSYKVQDSQGAVVSQTATVTIQGSDRVISAKLVSGPQIDGGAGTTMALYKADGTLLGKMAYDASSGQFKYTDTSKYTGVLVVKMVDTDTASDYMDEGTKQAKNFGQGTVLMSATNVDTSTNNVSLSINPLTTAAAKKLGISALATDSVLTLATPLTALDVLNTNKAIAKAFNILDASTPVDIARQAVKTTITTSGAIDSTVVNGTDVASAYGRALAVVSQSEKASNLSVVDMAQSIADVLVNNISASNYGTLTRVTSQITAVQNAITQATSLAQASGQLLAGQANDVIKSALATAMTMGVASPADTFLNTSETTVDLVINGNFASGQTLKLFNGTSALAFSIGVSPVAASTGYTFSGAVSNVTVTVARADLTNNATNSLTAQVSGGAAATTSNVLPVVVDTTVAVTNAALTTDSTNGLAGNNSDGTTNSAAITAPTNAEAGANVEYRVTKGTGSSAVIGDWSTSYTPPVSDGTADGVYKVEVRQTDKAGNASTAQVINFTLDSTAPAVPNAAFTDSSNGLAGNDTDSITNTAAINAPTNVESGGKVEYRITKDSGTPGAWSTSYIAPLANGSADGVYKVEVRQTDKAGNASIQTLNFTLDSTAPALPNAALTTDTAAGSATNTDGITRQGNITAPTNLETGAKVEYRITKDNGAPGAWSTSYTNPATDGSADGVYKVEVRETDKAGNASVQAINFTLDNQATSALSFVGLSAGATVQANQVLAGQGAEAGATVELLSDGAAVAVAQATAASDGSFIFTLPAPASAGAHTFTLRYTDKAGNTSTPSASTSVNWSSTIAAALPAQLTKLALSAATDSGVSTTDGITNIAAATLTGTGALSGATIEVTATTQGATPIATVLPTVTASVDGSWTLTLPGSNLLSTNTSFTVRQKASGGSSWSPASPSYAVVFDNTAPASAPTLVLDASSDTAARDNITASRNLLLTGMAEARAYVDLFDNGSKVATVQADSTGAWQTTLSGVSEAKHSYTARQSDAAGNLSATSAATVVTVDATVAVPGAATLDPGSDTGTLGDRVTTVTTPKLTGTGAESGATIQVFDGTNTTPVATATVQADGSWSANTSALSVGVHALRVSQTDVAGNISALSATTTLTIAAPAVVSAPSAPVLTAASDSGVSSTDGITNATSLTFSGTGAVAGGTVELWQGGIKLGTVSTAIAGAWSYTNTTLTEGAGQTIKARVLDASGNASDFSAITTFTIDRTAPTSALTLAALPSADDTGRLQTDGITQQNFPTISGSGATSGARVQIFNGTATTPLATFTADGSGNFSGRVVLPADGSYTLRAAELDAAGNIGPRSVGQVALTLDTTAASAPVITSSLSSLAGNPNISGTAEANAYVELFVGASTTPVVGGYANASGAWTLQYPQAAAGTYDLSVRQTDAAGNPSAKSTAASATITAASVNAVLPPQLAAPAFKTGEDTGVGGDGLTNKTNPVLVISGVDASITSTNVATNLKVYDGASLVAGSFVADSVAGSWQFTPTTALANASSHSFNATQTVGGNTSVASPSLAVSIDNAVAASALTHFGQVRYVLLKQTGASTNNLFVNEVQVYANSNSTTNIALNKPVTAGTVGQGTNGTAYPVSGVTNGSVTRDGGNGYASTTSTSDNWVQIDLGDFYAIDSVKVYALSSAASDLANTANLDVFASDQALSSYTYAQLTAGNGGALKVGSTGASPVYTTALTAPVVLQAGLSQPLITGTGEAGATVTIYDTPSGGTKTPLGTAVVNSSGVWTFQASGLAVGTHSLTTKQTDVAGNTSSTESAAQSFTVPAVVAPAAAPAITLLSTDDTGTGSVVVGSSTINYTSDNTTNKTSVTVRGSGATSGDTIQVYADLGSSNYELRGSAKVVSDGTWSLAGVTLAANASTTLVAKASNTAGSSGYSSSPLVLTNDSSNPVAPTVSLSAASDAGVQGDARTNIGATANTLTLSGTAEAGASITVTLGGATVGTATAGADGTWTSTPLTSALTPNAANALSVTATDKAGNTSAATSYTITHDNTLPTGTLVITSSLNAGVLPTVAGTGAEAGATVDIYSGATLLGSATASSSGTWSLVLSSISSAGSYNLTAKQRDAAGNVSATSTSFTLAVSDAIVPALLAPVLPNFSLLLADDTGTTGDNITAMASPRLTGTGAQANATVQVWEGSALVGSTTADTSGAWTITPNSPLSAGLHTLTVNQQVGLNVSPMLGYNNGNGLYVASTVPAPVIGTPTALFGGDNSVSWSEAVAGTATLSGTCLNNATVTVRYTNAAGTVVDKTAAVTPSTNSPAAATWQAPSLTAAELATLGAGNVTVSVKQTYGAVVSSLATATVAIERLSTPIINANIAGDDIISAAELATGTITGTAFSGAAVSVSITSSSTGISVTRTTTAASGTWSVAMLTQAEAASLGAGSSATSLTVSAIQTFSGVVSSPSSRSITLAAMAPATPVTISNAAIAVDNIINGIETPPSFTGTATAGASVSVTVTNTITGASVPLGSVTATGGNWTTRVLTAGEVTTLGGDNQPLLITATQTVPSGGGVSSATRTINVDTVAPAAPSAPALVADATSGLPSDSGVVGDNITQVTTPTFSGKANPGATVTLYQGSTQIGTGTADASTGVWTIKSSALASGSSYSITAKQADAAGNLSAASVAVPVSIDNAVAVPTFVPAGPVRYVLLKQTGGSTNNLFVNEVQVYANGVNVALNKSVTAGTAGQGGSVYPASGVTNGNLTRDGGNGYASTTSTSDNWVQIDLGDFYAIDSVKVYALSSTDLSTIANVDVFASGQALSSYTYTQLTAGSGGAVKVGGTGASPVYTTTLSAPSTLQATAQPIILGTGEAGATVTIYDTPSSSTKTTLGTAVVNSSGVWSFQASSITSGTHSITTQQTDVAGNTSAESAAYGFTVNAAVMGMPSLATASDSGLKGDRVTNVTTPTFSGTAITANGDVQVLDGTTVLATVTATGTNWSFTPGTGLSNGVHSITARDVSENKTSSALSLTVDTVANAPVITAPTAANTKVAPVVAGTGAEAGATITLTATAADSSSQSFTAVANASGAWSVDTGVAVVGGNTALVANKVYTLRATQTDAAGNTSAASAAQSVNYDTQISGLTINTVPASSASTLTLTGAGEAGATVRVYDGVASLGTATVNAQGGWSLVVSGLSNGAHTFKAEQSDAAGNLSAQVTASTTVDNSLLSAPQLAAVSDSGSVGDGITNATTPSFSGKAAANATVELWDTFNGVSSKAGTAVANASGVWSLNSSLLGEGAHSLVVKELNADNTTVARTSGATALTVDTTASGAPTLQLASASDSAAKGDGITNVVTPTLSGKADANAWVQVFLGSSVIGTVQANGSGDWSYTATAQTDGAKSFSAKQLDAAGNLSAASVVVPVTIDNAVAVPIFVPPGLVRYVLLKQTGGSTNNLFVNEVQVYANGVNVALNKSVTAGTAGQGGSVYPASGVTNGNLTRDGGNGYASTTSTSDNWVQIDLGDFYAIDSVKVYALSSTDLSTIANVDVFASGQALSSYTYTQLTAGNGGAVKVGGTGTTAGYTTTLSTPSTLQATFSSQPFILGTGEAGATVTIYDTSSSGTKTTLGTAVVNSSGVWTFQASSITSGTHSITTQQTDVAGNTSAESAAYGFTVNTAAMGVPSLATASDSGVKGDGITKVTTPTLSGNAITSGGQVQILDGSTPLGTVTATGNSWSFTPSTGLSLSDGVHTITARDVSENKTSSALSLTVDTVANAPVISAPAANTKVAPVVAGTGAEAGATITLTATAADGSSSQSFTTLANASGAWSVDTGVTAGSNTALVANKVYAFRATQTDAAGNTSAASAAQSVNYDTVVAVPTVNTVPASSASTLTLTGTGEVGAVVRVYDGVASLGTATVNAQGGWSLVLSGLSNGAHTFKAEQTDLAGNLSAQVVALTDAGSGGTTVTVNSSVLSAPQLAAVSDSGSVGDGITNATTPSFSGKAAANATVELWDTLNGVSSKAGTAVANASGVWSLNSSLLGEGTHSLVVKELNADTTVARTSGATALTVDTTASGAPTLQLASASDSGAKGDGITNVVTPTLSGKADANAWVQVYSGSSVIGTVQANSSGDWSYTTTVQSDGLKSYSVQQQDAAGNVSARSGALSLTVDSVNNVPTLNAFSGPQGSNPILSGTAEAYATVRATVGASTLTTQADGTGVWRVQLALAPTAVTGYNVSVQSTDLAGNDSPTVQSRFSVDPSLGANASLPATLGAPMLAAPTLGAGQDTGLSSSDNIINLAKPVLTGSGAQSGATVQLWANGVQVASTTAQTDGSYSFNAASYSSTLNDTNRLSVVQVVGSGASAASSVASPVLTLVVDTFVAYTTPALASSATDSSGVRYSVSKASGLSTLVSGTAEAGARVAVYDNNSLVDTVTADALGNWRLDLAASLQVSGSHSLTTQVTDVAGNVSVLSSPYVFKTLTSAPTAPQVSVQAGGDSGRSSSDGVTNITSQWFTGTVQAATASTDAPSVNLYDNGVLIANVKADRTGAWTYNATLAEGGHVITAQAVDLSKNTSSVVSVANLTVDTTTASAPAQASLGSGQDTGSNLIDGVTRLATPEFTGTVEGAASVELYDNGLLVGTALADASGLYSVSPTLALAQGGHSITVRQVDAAGNRSAASVAKTITVDSVVGNITALSMSSTDVLYTSADGIVANKLHPTLKGYGETGATVEVFNTTTTGTQSVGTALVGADGSWSLTLGADLAASNSITARQTDVAGNMSATSAALAVAYSAGATSPMISLQSSSDTGALGDGITSRTTPSVVGGGAAAGDTVTLYNDSTALGTTLADSAGNWSITPSTALADNTYTLTAKNTSQADKVLGSLRVTIDSQPGAVLTGLALDAASDTGTVGDKLTRLGSSLITGSGASAGASVRLFEGSTLLGVGVADATGNWRVQTSTLSSGSHSLTAVQVDAAGNASSASAAYVLQVDTLAATLATPLLVSADDTGLSGDGRTSQSSIHVSGTDAEAGAWVSVYNGTQQLARVQAGSNGAWQATLDNLAGSASGVAYSLTATQTDAAGNTSANSAALALTVDRAALAPSIGLLATASNDTGTLGDGRTQNTRPVLTGTAEAGASVQVLRDEGDGTSTVLATLTAEASSGAWSWQPGTDLALGSYKYLVRQTDVAGNTSPLSQSLNVTILPVLTTNLTSLSGAVNATGGQLIDFNNDGLVDVVSGFAYTQTPSGGFVKGANTSWIAAVNVSTFVDIASTGYLVDINNDGVKDFVTVKNNVWFASTSGAKFDSNVSGASANSAQSAYVAVADVLGTGQLASVSNGGARLWVANGKQVGVGGDNLSDRVVSLFDANADGYLDVVYGDPGYGIRLSNGDGSGFTKSTAAFPISGYSASHTTTLDINNDGVLDVFNGQQVLRGLGNGRYTDVTSAVGYSGGNNSESHVVVADLNGDGWQDLIVGETTSNVKVWLNRSGTLQQIDSNTLFDRPGQVLNNFKSTQLSAMDVNGDRSIDMAVIGANNEISLSQNQSVVAENTYLRVRVDNSTGNDSLAAGATVTLYDSATGALVATQLIGNNVLGSYMSRAGLPYAEFFGLDSAKTYDVVVRYPGNDQGVTVLTGKSGLGVAGIASSALREVVDSQLTAVSPGGKDVITVARENRSTATDGGNWVGTRYADWMVGDAGDDTFTPNGANVGEVGDTIDLSNGGHDKVVFNSLMNLNTPATIISFTLGQFAAGAGQVANSDTINVSGLLTALGYTGARDAASVASVLRVVQAGDMASDGFTPLVGTSNLLLQATNTSGAWQNVALIKGAGVASQTLASLVASGNLQLGQLTLSSATATTLTEAQAKAGLTALFGGVTLGADGAVYAQDFSHASIQVSLGDMYAEDQFSLKAGAGVTLNGSSVLYNGVAIGTVNSSLNGVGKALEVDFSFTGSSLSKADQAAAVQTVVQAVQYQNTGNTPPDYYRDLTLQVSDGESTVRTVSQLTVTPVADTATVAGRSVVSGTNGVDTLGGTSANETLAGYGGPVANAGTASATGDTLTGVGGHDTFVYRKGNVGMDTITDFGAFKGQGANADVINVVDLLQGFTWGSSNINDFVRVVDAGTNGGTAGVAQVQVDYNGKADGSGFEPYMVMNLTGVTLASTGMGSFAALRDTLVAHDQLVLSNQQLSAQTTALAKIVAYATNQTNATPGKADYAAAGVTDVSDFNLSALNAAVVSAGASVVNDAFKVQDLVYPTLTGTATQNSPLSVNYALSSGVNYQWQANGVDITSATSASYTLQQSEVGKVVTVVLTSASDSAFKVGSVATSNVANVNDVGTVAINGTVDVGNTLNAVVTDLDGLTGVTIGYQWMADGTNISGATSASLVLASAQADKAISVKASYTDALGGVEAPVSSATGAVPIALTNGVNDTVVINTANAAVNTHTVKNFEVWNSAANSGAGAGDKLSLTNLLQGGYNSSTSDLTQWVTKSFAGGNTTLVVDLDGAGAGTATQTIVLPGVDLSSQTLAQLKTSGVIVA